MIRRDDEVWGDFAALLIFYFYILSRGVFDHDNII